MATVTKDKASTAPSNPYDPVVWESYEAEKADRAEARAKKAKTLRRAVDPTEAAAFESRKPVYDYEVECTYSVQAPKGGLEFRTTKEVVRAQNERDAWAKFCDKVKAWPSPKTSERMITRLRSVQDPQGV